MTQSCTSRINWANSYCASSILYRNSKAIISLMSPAVEPLSRLVTPTSYPTCMCPKTLAVTMDKSDSRCPLKMSLPTSPILPGRILGCSK